VIKEQSNTINLHYLFAELEVGGFEINFSMYLKYFNINSS